MLVFTLFVDDPEPVLAWLAEHGGQHVLQRQVVPHGNAWTLKIGLDDADVCDQFRERFHASFMTVADLLANRDGPLH